MSSGWSLIQSLFGPVPTQDETFFPQHPPELEEQYETKSFRSLPFRLCSGAA